MGGHNSYEGDLVLEQNYHPGYRLTQQEFGNGPSRDIAYYSKGQTLYTGFLALSIEHR